MKNRGKTEAKSETAIKSTWDINIEWTELDIYWEHIELDWSIFDINWAK